MFTPSRRDDVRRQLLELARQDPQIPAAANTGSYAVDGGDAFSDIDLAFAITGELPAALGRWTELLRRDFGAVQHWDLPVEPSRLPGVPAGGRAGGGHRVHPGGRLRSASARSGGWPSARRR